jgi:hypothetical protein
VDLGKLVNVKKIVIYNRQDGDQSSLDRLDGTVVSLMDNKYNIVWTTTLNSTSRQEFIIKKICGGPVIEKNLEDFEELQELQTQYNRELQSYNQAIQERLDNSRKYINNASANTYVPTQYVKLNLTGNWLHFQEVEVYDETGTNVARSPDKTCPTDYPYVAYDGDICYSSKQYADAKSGPCGTWCTNDVTVGTGCGDPESLLCSVIGKTPPGSIKATMSSSGFSSNAYMALDGNVSDTQTWPNSPHSNTESGGWWQVDLGKIVNVTKIVVYNRPDCCQSRLNGTVISLMDNNNKIVWTATLNSERRQEFIINYANRYVRDTTNGAMGYVTEQGVYKPIRSATVADGIEGKKGCPVGWRTNYISYTQPSGEQKIYDSSVPEGQIIKINGVKLIKGPNMIELESCEEGEERNNLGTTPEELKRINLQYNKLNAILEKIHRKIIQLGRDDVELNNRLIGQHNILKNRLNNYERVYRNIKNTSELTKHSDALEEDSNLNMLSNDKIFLLWSIAAMGLTAGALKFMK